MGMLWYRDKSLAIVTLYPRDHHHHQQQQQHLHHLHLHLLNLDLLHHHREAQGVHDWSKPTCPGARDCPEPPEMHCYKGHCSYMRNYWMLMEKHGGIELEEKEP